jgi:hypothetical protein
MGLNLVARPTIGPCSVVAIGSGGQLAPAAAAEMVGDLVAASAG